MATSGTIATVPFETLKVIDLAFRRVGIFGEKVTPEMQSYAKDSLQLVLSNLANPNIPSWCIERVVLPMYQGQPIIPLPVGTVAPLDVNYRFLSPVVQDALPTPAMTLTYDAENITTAGILWGANSVPVTFQASIDGITWTTVGATSETHVAGEWEWVDVVVPVDGLTEFRLTASSNIQATEVYLGTDPQNIPLGVLNRDQYSQQSNLSFPSQPTQYWYNRKYPIVQIELWPAPNYLASRAQIVMWRQRHIMDVGTLRQNIEMPQQWMDAIIDQLAMKVGISTPDADMARLQLVRQDAPISLQKAWDGDGDGAPTQITFNARPYTA